MKFHHTLRLTRLIPAFAAVLALGTSASASAAAAPQVSVVVGGRSFGNGSSFRVTSAPWTIAPSKLYSYSVAATCSGVAPKNTPAGTVTLANLVPAGTPLAAFMNSIAPGSGSLLKGTYSNPTGKLPAVVVNRKISGSETVPFPDGSKRKVSVSLNLKVEILANGQAVAEINSVNIRSASTKIPGTIKFGKGSKVTLATAPEIQFERGGQIVGEAVESAQVLVWRYGNQGGKASVRYSTADGTAKAGVDYTAVSGVVNFGDKETVKTISVPILNNSLKDGYRKFTISLSSPSKGALLGSRTLHNIGIQSED